MDAREVLSLSKDALMSNKMRSLLTMLGVIIGVASVIMLVAIGAGAKSYIHRELGNLGTNILIVVPGKTSTKGGIHPPTASTIRKLVYDDAVILQKTGPPYCRCSTADPRLLKGQISQSEQGQ